LKSIYSPVEVMSLGMLPSLHWIVSHDYVCIVLGRSTKDDRERRRRKFKGDGRV